MARIAPHTALTALAALATAAVLSIAASDPAPASAQAPTARSCGVQLTPVSRNVRRGGKVLLRGEGCAAGSSSSGGSRVQVKLQKNKRWATVAKGQTDSNGDFTVCAKVSVPRTAKVARLRATAGGATGSTTVRVANKGTSGCGDKPGGGYKPPPPEVGNPDCPLSQPGSKIGLTLPSACTVVTADTASNSNPLPFWGKLDCQNSSRHQQVGSGGDTHAMGVGGAQSDGAFRRISVMDGDDVWGERCEMGYNWHGSGDPGTGINGPGPTVLYHEGMRRVTYISIRLPNSMDVGDPDWRTVYQNKQSQPYDNPAMGSMFEMQVRGGQWTVISNWSEPLWTAPAQTGQWVRFAFDITYSQDPNKGRIKVYADLNGDGDANDGNEESPAIQRPTLLTETKGPNGDVGAGNSIPSHMRAGVYQNSTYMCPPPSGCFADFDNIQVVKA